ncbi:MAG TPA: transketolase C-terminal domain-containing protein [Mycobacteriales bacterium]|jgi:transketolase|nr:transketolase C-terminal domain-containing protein [Mycobacteriales bacterium]
MNSTQDQAEIFRGTAEGQTTLRDDRSTDRISAAAIPAFVFGEELADLADDDPRIVVLTADLAGANRSSDFAARHPARFFNLGIAEKNMITTAAGLAASGQIAYAATFASFCALLGAEQIRTDCAYPGVPVRIVGSHAGMSMGFYGSSHHALEDLGMMRTIADLTVVCPADANALRAVLRLSLSHPGAMYIRLGRGRDPQVYDTVPDLELGRATRVREGDDVAVLATGTEVHPALEAADLLARKGISVRVVDVHTISPIDVAEVLAAAELGQVITVEEHNVTGGLGSAVAEVLADRGVGVPLLRHGVPDTYVLIGPPGALYAHYRLDAPGIAGVVEQALASRSSR